MLPTERRFEKSKEVQLERTKKHAEVFTPLHIIDKMVSYTVEEFGPDIVEKTYLDICCGEGHFITTRYDPYSGEFIPEPERVGILDRKLRICTNILIAWKALKSVYGYEIQKDSLEIARQNVLDTFIEWCMENGFFDIKTEAVKKAIAERFILMDGLTYRNPETGDVATIADPDSGEMVKFTNLLSEGM